MSFSAHIKVVSTTSPDTERMINAAVCEKTLPAFVSGHLPEHSPGARGTASPSPLLLPLLHPAVPSPGGGDRTSSALRTGSWSDITQRHWNFSFLFSLPNALLICSFIALPGDPTL